MTCWRAATGAPWDDAHGGLKRWSGVSTLTAKLAAGGPFWGQQEFPDAFLDETLTIDTRRQHAVFTPWTAPGQSLTFDTDPERVVLQTANGQTTDSRTSPRSCYAGHDLHSRWDALAPIPVVRHGRLCHTEQAFLSPVIVPLTVGPTGRGTRINDLQLGSASDQVMVAGQPGP